jgi:hypothetical protein
MNRPIRTPTSLPKAAPRRPADGGRPWVGLGSDPTHTAAQSQRCEGPPRGRVRPSRWRGPELPAVFRADVDPAQECPRPATAQYCALSLAQGAALLAGTLSWQVTCSGCSMPTRCSARSTAGSASDASPGSPLWLTHDGGDPCRRRRDHHLSGVGPVFAVAGDIDRAPTPLCRGNDQPARYRAIRLGTSSTDQAA